ncbi:hypothetical protein MKX01_033970 [Papaver californicum]|nr:hypothetical protein MKX01_033970 [Papaver californicum]
MVSVTEMPILQDGPPPSGPSAVAIFLATFTAFSWGMYEVGKGNKVRRALKKEKYAARRAILPMLHAEEDEKKRRIMKDVPGWKVGESVYHSKRWMPPACGELRPDVW